MSAISPAESAMTASLFFILAVFIYPPEITVKYKIIYIISPFEVIVNIKYTWMLVKCMMKAYLLA